MLSSMVKEHQTKQKQHKDAQEKKRETAMQSSTQLTKALVDHLNVGVAQAYLNQKRLDVEANQLESNATQFKKSTGQWLNLISSFSSALKEVGDVENWAMSMQADMKSISNTLEVAYKTNQST